MKKMFIIIFVGFCLFSLFGCQKDSQTNQNNIPNDNEDTKQNTDYHLSIQYSLNEKDDYMITFNEKTISDIKLDEIVVDGYTFLGYYENDKKVESIGLRDYNLITKYEENEYHINISYKGIEKENEVINFTVSSLNDIKLEEKEDNNKLFIGYYENDIQIIEIIELKNYNLEARFIDYDIFLIDLDWTNFDGMLYTELEEKYPQFVLDPTKMYANLLTIDVLDDNLLSESFDISIGKYPQVINEALNNGIIDSEDLLFYWEVIPVLNDIINNHVVIGTCTLNDEATLRIYSKRGEEVLFDSTYSVNANDYIIYSTNVVKDYSGNDNKYIYNKYNDEYVEELSYPVSLFFTTPDETKKKVEEFVKTEKVDDTKTINDYLSDLRVSYDYQIIYDVTAVIVVNGQEITRTFHLIENKIS